MSSASPSPTAVGDEYRIEHDTMGEVRVPIKRAVARPDAAAVENFPISGRGLNARRSGRFGLLKAHARK